MPNPSRYARSSRNKSPLISTNDMKLPEIAPTQNSQSPKRETSTLIPPQNYGKQNTVVKSQHHHTDFRTTETRNFRITRNKGNLEYKLGKKNAFEPDQNQVVVKAKL